jgi:hypothetical protein
MAMAPSAVNVSDMTRPVSRYYPARAAGRLRRATQKEISSKRRAE